MATAEATGLKLKNFVNGEQVDALSGAVSEVRDPASGELVGSVPKGGAEDARRAIDAADAAYEAWSDTGVQERARLLSKAHDVVHHHVPELAQLLNREQGKPVSE